MSVPGRQLSEKACNVGQFKLEAGSCTGTSRGPCAREVGCGFLSNVKMSCMRPSMTGVSVGTRQLRKLREAIDKRGLGGNMPTPSAAEGDAQNIAQSPSEHDRHRDAPRPRHNSLHRSLSKTQ